MQTELYFHLEHTFQFLSLRDLVSCSKVCAKWRVAAENKHFPQYQITTPLSTDEFKLCPRKFLPTIATLNITHFGPSVLISAFPHLANLQHLDLSHTAVTRGLVKSLATDITLLPKLKYLNISHSTQKMNFCYVQQLAQSRYGTTRPEIVYDEARFVSLGSRHETQITFCNLHTGVVLVEWLDFKGLKVHYITLRPLDHYTQATFKTHPWVVMDNNNNVLLRTVGMKFPQVVKIGEVMSNLIPLSQPLATVATNPQQIISFYNSTPCELHLTSYDTTAKETNNTITILPKSQYDLDTHESEVWVVRVEDCKEMCVIAARSYQRLKVHLWVMGEKRKLYLQDLRSAYF